MDKTESKTLLQMVIVCFFGGFIGTIVALEVARMFCWIGLLIGALVGYVSYDFKRVSQACKTVWEELRAEMKEEPTKRKIEMLKRRKIRWRIRMRKWAGILGVMATYMMYVVFSGYVYKMLTNWTAYKMLNNLAWLAFTASFILGIYFAFAEFYNRNSMVNEARMRRQRQKGIYSQVMPTSRACRNRCLAIMVLGNPIVFPFTALWYCLKQIPKIPAAFMKAMKFLGTVICTLAECIRDVSIMIHSEKRLICADGAFFGVIVGYFCGSAVVGGLTGSVIGLLEYEIVSKRLLHLNPS